MISCCFSCPKSLVGQSRERFPNKSQRKSLRLPIFTSSPNINKDQEEDQEKYGDHEEHHDIPTEMIF